MMRGVNTQTVVVLVALILIVFAPIGGEAQSTDPTLRLSAYVTAGSVDTYLQNTEGREEALALFREFGITKVYLEVYRGGRVVGEDRLRDTRDFFSARGIDVVGGIAMCPAAISVCGKTVAWAGLTGRTKKRSATLQK